VSTGRYSVAKPPLSVSSQGRNKKICPSRFSQGQNEKIVKKLKNLRGSGATVGFSTITLKRGKIK